MNKLVVIRIFAVSGWRLYPNFTHPHIQLCLRRGPAGEGGTSSWLPPSGGPSRNSGTRSSPLIKCDYKATLHPKIQPLELPPLKLTQVGSILVARIFRRFDYIKKNVLRIILEHLQLSKLKILKQNQSRLRSRFH